MISWVKGSGLGPIMTYIFKIRYFKLTKHFMQPKQ